MPVAEASAFVGRRRALQNVFRAFRNPPAPGVLIYGFGGHGKSSLAARVADRCSRYKTALVCESYDAGKVFDEVLTAVPGEEAVELRDRWNKRIADNPSTLKYALRSILTNQCATYELDGIVRQPLLLIIDDLQNILDQPAPGTGIKAAVKAAFKPVLTAVLEAFTETTGETKSRLILTSRYDFTLRSTTGVDVAERLTRVQIHPFDPLERQKQQSALARGALPGRRL